MQVYGLFIVSGLAVGALYALGGVGLVLLYRATGVLNFGYGAIGAICALTAWEIMQRGGPEILSWFAALLLGIVLSLLYGRYIAARMAHREQVVKAVATLGLALILLGIMNWTWIDDPRKLSLATDKTSLSILGMRVSLTRFIVIVAGAAFVFGLTQFLQRTRVGLSMRALASNRDIAAILGTPVVRIETIAWGISGVLAGFTGLMFGALVRLDATVLTFMVIPVIAAAVVGRLQSLGGAFAGGLAIGLVESLLTLVPAIAPFRSASPFVVAALVILWMQRRRKLTFADGD
jgi:branched-chain amino acid transport system permease protein